MSYIEKLTDGQLLELVQVFDQNAEEIIERNNTEDGADVKVSTAVMIEDDELVMANDFWCLYDYDVEPYDWGAIDHDEIVEYRKKMLDWFGTDYAVGFLLG